MKRLLLVFIILLANLSSIYSQVIEIGKSKKTLLLSDKIYFHIDSTQKLGISDAIEKLKKNEKTIVFTEGNIPTFKYTANVWGIFELKNTDTNTVSKVLEIDNNFMDSITLYKIIGNKPMLIGYAGDWVNVKDRQAQTPTRTFDLHIQPKKTETYLLKLNVTRRKIIDFNLFYPTEYNKKISTQNLIFGAFLGGFLILFLYSLIIFILKRERIFILYSIYILATSIGVSYMYGYTYNYFFHNLGSKSEYLASASPIWCISFILITIDFLELKKYSQAMFKLTTLALILYTFSFISFTIWYSINPNFPVILLANIALGIIVCVLIIVSIVMLNKNREATLFYLFSFTPVILGLILFILLRSDVFKSSFLDNYLFIITSFLEILIMSIGIANKLRLENKLRLDLTLQVAKKEKELYTKLEDNSEKERINIAHTLHDSFGARLKQIKSFVNTNETIKANSEIGLLAKDIRDLSHAMSPTILDHLSISEATEDLINTLNNPLINFHFFDNKSTFSLSKKTKTVLYNIIQELITNSINHGKPNNVSIQFNYFKEELTVTIEDDGIGFDPSTIRRGIGIQSIKQRVSQLGGSIIIKSSINTGVITIIKIKQ